MTDNELKALVAANALAISKMSAEADERQRQADERQRQNDATIAKLSVEIAKMKVDTDRFKAEVQEFKEFIKETFGEFGSRLGNLFKQSESVIEQPRP